MTRSIETLATLEHTLNTILDELDSCRLQLDASLTEAEEDDLVGKIKALSTRRRELMFALGEAYYTERLLVQRRAPRAEPTSPQPSTTQTDAPPTHALAADLTPDDPEPEPRTTTPTTNAHETQTGSPQEADDTLPVEAEVHEVEVVVEAAPEPDPEPVDLNTGIAQLQQAWGNRGFNGIDREHQAREIKARRLRDAQRSIWAKLSAHPAPLSAGQVGSYIEQIQAIGALEQLISELLPILTELSAEHHVLMIEHLMARARSLAGIYTIHERVMQVMHDLHQHQEQHRPGYIFGLAEGHTPRRATWFDEAAHLSERLEVALCGITPDPHRAPERLVNLFEGYPLPDPESLMTSEARDREDKILQELVATSLAELGYLPGRVQVLTLELIQARLRALQEIHPGYQRLDLLVDEMIKYLRAARPGIAHGFARDHEPRSASWLDDARSLERELLQTLPRLTLRQPATTEAAPVVNGAIEQVDTPDEEEYEDDEADLLSPLPEGWAWLAHTQGKRAVIIGGGCREHARRRLENAFGFETLDWLDEKKGGHTYDSVADRVSQGNVDFVIITRFAGHANEFVLKEPCKASGVPKARLPRGYGVGSLQHWIEQNLPAMPAS